MNKKWTKSTLNCEAYSSFEGVSSDHRFVTAKIRLSLCRNASQTTKTARYDWSMLNNRDNCDKYTITQRNKFNALHEISESLSPNDEYKTFVNAHLETAAECILCRNFGKELVILFHRSAAAPWGHVVSIIKRSSTGVSPSFGSTATTFSNRSFS